MKIRKWLARDTNGEVPTRVGRICLRRRDFAAAIRYLGQAAIRAAPNEEGPCLDLGEFFVHHMAYDAALANFRAAQQTLPQSMKLALGEAIVLNLANRREESYQWLLEIEKRWPEQDLPYVLAGIAAYSSSRFDDARWEFTLGFCCGTCAAACWPPGSSCAGGWIAGSLPRTRLRR